MLTGDRINRNWISVEPQVIKSALLIFVFPSGGTASSSSQGNVSCAPALGAYTDHGAGSWQSFKASQVTPVIQCLMASLCYKDNCCPESRVAGPVFWVAAILR